MLKSFFSWLFGAPAKPRPEIHTPPNQKPRDPLDVMGPHVEPDDLIQTGFESISFLTAKDFPQVEDFQDLANGAAAHAESAPVETLRKRRYVGDGYAEDALTGQGTNDVKSSFSAYQVPDALQNWYNSQSFIGYQACALIAQHWLVDKCCTMPGEDAVRNGYEVSVVDEDSPDFEKFGIEPDEIVKRIREKDRYYGIRDHLVQLWRFREIYGIRVCIFDIESDDDDFYAKPFNIDGVTKGSYRGIRQIDPYWMMPVLSGEETVNPTSLHFYEPSYWTIGGKKYHRSHLIICRGPMPADILKPTYIFGGIPLTQRIYERVYASERTANEGPLLAMTKRTNVLHVDLPKAEAQPGKFMARLMKWVALRDNMGVKTVGIDETVEQFDTSLADLDSVIMTQYQLVAAIAEVPSTKLLGTSPKGFNSTGEFESKSYHERLETVHTYLQPLLDRHHRLLIKSEFDADIPVEAVWNRVDSFTAQELADLNAKKMDIAEKAITLGVISPDDDRQRLKNDPLSGYNNLGEEEASPMMGGSPENLIDLKKAEADTDKGEAMQTKAGAAEAQVEKGKTDEMDAGSLRPHLDKLRKLLSPQTNDDGPDMSAVASHLDAIYNLLGEFGGNDDPMNELRDVLSQIQARFKGTNDELQSEGQRELFKRTVKPEIQPNVQASTHSSLNIGDTSSAGLIAEGGAQWTQRAMPKIRVSRLTVFVENPKGSIRAGTTLAGEDWRSLMPAHYGYINGVIGADGDELDAFVGPDPQSKKVWVINQIEPTTGEFDEHKVMLGFNSEDEALQCYREAFQKGWEGFSSIHEFDMDEFRIWMRSADLELACVH